MAAFDVSFLNPKLRPASKDYGFLADQLTILENQLESDGKLSPGDYDILQVQAQKIYGHPGLTKEQRSNIETKMSSYQKSKKTTQLKDTQDIQRLNRAVEDDFNAGTMTLSNNPTAFLKQRSDVLRLKIDQLTLSIEQLQSAGDDATMHVNELTSAMKQYKDVLEAFDDAKKTKGDGKPGSAQVAYITTNSRGEITDVSVGRLGSKTGYSETNGLYGPFQIYGKVNYKDPSTGKLVFKFGPESFSAADIIQPDPMNPSSFRTPKLLSESQQAAVGPFSMTKGGQFKQIDLSQVSPMNSIEIDDYVQGDKGFIYKKNANGKFTKYVNQTPEQLGIKPNDILRVPRILESQIINSVDSTIDPVVGGFNPVLPPVGTVPPPGGAASAVQAQASSGEASSAVLGRPRTPAPTERAAQGFLGVAASTLKSAGGFLKGLFGNQ